MVRSWLFSLAAIACVATGQPASARAFPASTVHVLKSGQWSPNRYGDQTSEQRARFTPSDAEVRHWFRRARIVDQVYWLEQTEWTQCSAEGVAVSLGQTVHWRLDQAGRGSVTKPGATDVYLSGPELSFHHGRIGAE